MSDKVFSREEKAKLTQLINKGLTVMQEDRKRTRLNSIHLEISYDVCCLKIKRKKKKQYN